VSTVRAVFRVDASLEIGTGHVMRCLTLAQALRDRGGSCAFVCRADTGHLIDEVRRRGFAVTALPAGPAVAPSPAHAAWLGAPLELDAQQTLASLPGETDWIVVDHYALDARWEREMRGDRRRLMVIDDLADRQHDCELLLDANLGRSAADYAPLVPAACVVLAGPRHALLRPEFAALRPASLARRAEAPVRKLLVAMGGVDAPDVTSAALQALAGAALPTDCSITVVMGAHAPWLAQVREAARRLPWPAEVVVNAQDLARRMADSDLAIGAAGTTAWERCCLGLPSLATILAENQRAGAQALFAAGAAVAIPPGPALPATVRREVERLAQDRGALTRMQQASAAVTDGTGAARVAAEMLR
jgi:UDP-2,4-diacetamido-2,4,6-trideoxy-beta-L-altropyranose hydrolase